MWIVIGAVVAVLAAGVVWVWGLASALFGRPQWHWRRR